MKAVQCVVQEGIIRQIEILNAGAISHREQQAVALVPQVVHADCIPVNDGLGEQRDGFGRNDVLLKPNRNPFALIRCGRIVVVYSCGNDVVANFKRSGTVIQRFNRNTRTLVLVQCVSVACGTCSNVDIKADVLKAG